MHYQLTSTPLTIVHNQLASPKFWRLLSKNSDHSFIPTKIQICPLTATSLIPYHLLPFKPKPYTKSMWLFRTFCHFYFLFLQTVHQIASILEKSGAHTNPHRAHNQPKCFPCSDALHFTNSNFNISFIHWAESGIIPTRKLSHQIPTLFNLIIYFISFLQTNALNFNH